MILELHREFTVNMGNYESVKIGGTVRADESEGRDLDKELRKMLREDLVRAAQISDVKNTFVLTWLEETDAKRAE